MIRFLKHSKLFYDVYSQKDQNNILYVNESFIKQNSVITNYAKEINHWDWIYAKTLPFWYEIKLNNGKQTIDLKLYIKQGRISAYEINQKNTKLIPVFINFLKQTHHYNWNI